LSWRLIAKAEVAFLFSTFLGCADAVADAHQEHISNDEAIHRADIADSSLMKKGDPPRRAPRDKRFPCAGDDSARSHSPFSTA
jgi:hypothetical protein